MQSVMPKVANVVKSLTEVSQACKCQFIVLDKDMN